MGNPNENHIGLQGLVLYSNSTACVMEDANEDEEKGRVDEKAGRWVGEHGLSQVARAMTLSPSWPGLEMFCTYLQSFTATRNPIHFNT
jgi:hypothetical protein